jgi:hypothetical protein
MDWDSIINGANQAYTWLSDAEDILEGNTNLS